MRKAGEKEVTEDAISQWLEENEGDPGYQVRTKRDTAEELKSRDETDEESDDDVEEERPVCKIKLSELRYYIDDLITI
jgi:hypothetical protein